MSTPSARGFADEPAESAAPGAESDPFLESYSDTSDPTFSTDVHGEKIRRTEKSTALAETIDVSDAAESMSSLGDVLSRAVGVEVRSTGGLGAYGAASIRGSTANQVPVYLDGIQVQSGGTSAVDLSDFMLDAFDSLEVYRGSTPLSVGPGGIGGALYLKTRECDSVGSQVAATYGSWRTWRGFGLQCAPIGKMSALVLLSARGSQGDFEYLDRNGTMPLNETDDRVVTRTNNHHTDYYTLLKMEGPVGSWRWTVANSILAKQGGVPGSENAQTRRPSSEKLGDRITLRTEGRASDLVSLEILAGYAGHRENFLDPDLEFNQTARSITSRTHVAQGGVSGNVDWSPSHRTVVSARNHFETFEHNERLDSEARQSPQVVMKRIRSLVGVQHDFRPWPSFLLSPQFRGEVHNARYQASSDRYFWSPALGASWESIEGLVFRANVGRYVRTPDLAELFGYSGSVIGNPRLKEEVGVNVDLGATFEHRSSGPVSRLRLSGAWFGSFSDDLIAYEQNSQNSVYPVNVGKALATGAESSLGIVLMDAVTLDANYTYLYGRDRSDTTYNRGNQLPGLPAHRFYSKLALGRDSAGDWGGLGWLDVDVATETYLKRSNQPEHMVPRRLLFGCGYRLSHQPTGVALTLSIRNLLNRTTFFDVNGNPAPFSDYVGFPLPGRTVLLTLHWRG